MLIVNLSTFTFVPSITTKLIMILLVFPIYLYFLIAIIKKFRSRVYVVLQNVLLVYNVHG